MFRALPLLVLLMLTSCGFLTPAPVTKYEPVIPKVSERLREPCPPSLPPLEIAPGDTDIRPELLNNRVESDQVYQECSAKHRGVLRAVGLTTTERRAARRTALESALKSQTTTKEPQ